LKRSFEVEFLSLLNKTDVGLSFHPPWCKT